MGIFDKKPNYSEEYSKLYNLYVEVSGQFRMLKTELEALKLELENLKAKYKYIRNIKNPEASPDGEASGLPPTPKSLNTFSPFV